MRDAVQSNYHLELAFLFHGAGYEELRADWSGALVDERGANAVDRRVGQRVRSRRLEVGMSQERLADMLGITFQQIQKYEKGVNRISASRLWDISLALEIPVSNFFDGIGNLKSKSPPSSEIDDALATPEGTRLVKMFSSLKDRKLRRRVVELVAAMVED